MIKRSILALSVFALSACLPAQLKVNEVSTASVSWIEVINLGAPLNINGYKVRYGGNSGISFNQNVFTCPNMVLGTNQVIVLTEDIGLATPTVPAGVFKAYCGAPLPWVTTPAVGANGVVAVNDPSDIGLDRMKWGNPLQDFGVYGSPWTGSIAPTASAMFRSSPTDTDTPADWTSTASPTPGAVNPGQANVIDIQFLSTPGQGNLTVNIITVGPAVPNGEIYTLVSLIDSNPDGSGPIFGVGIDVLLQPTQGWPFHTNLDGSGNWQLIVPPGGLPLGLHLEAVSLLVQGSITRISTVEVITI
jgi:hypothetical protein